MQPAGNEEGVVAAQKAGVLIQIIDRYKLSLGLHFCGLQAQPGISCV